MTSPIPTPKMNMYSAMTQPLVEALNSDSSQAPRVIKPVPTMGKIRYRPHRVTNRPDITER